MARRLKSYSRLRAYKEKQIKKKLFIVSILTTSIFTFVFLYGLNYLPSWVEFITNLVNRQAKVTTQIAEKPLPPSLDPIPEYVNESKIKIQGTALPGSIIKLFLDGNFLGETVVDKQGSFSYLPTSKIADGKHKLTSLVVAQQQESDLSEPINFILDTTEPELVIESPEADNQINLTADDDKIIKVTGQSESGVKVEVNQRLAKVSVDGSFEVDIPVEAGEQEIKAVSTDKAGNQKEVTIKVTVNVED